MRIDKFFSSTATLTRSQCQKRLKAGDITVNGVVVKNGDFKVNPETDDVRLSGEKILYSRYVYIILNKPRGVVSATDDLRETTVLDLLPPEYKKLGLFPCGRLDKDTLGLVVLTNDGVAAHNALSPKRHVEKKYLFTVADPYSNEDVAAIEKGITLRDGYTTKPCKISRIDDRNGYIFLTEGKYHEIKRLFGARGNKIVFLKRVSFGEIRLGELPESSWRFMSEDEISLFTR